MLSRLADKITYFNVIRTCWRYCDRAERRRMVLIYCSHACSNALALTRPVIIGGIVATVTAGGPDFTHHLLWWIFAFIAEHILYWVFMGPARIQERKLSLSLRQSLTKRLYKEVTSLPWLWHQAHHTGDTINRITTATRALFLFADNQFEFMNLFSRLIGATVMLLIIAPRVGFIMILVAVPLFYVIRRFDAASMRLNKEQNNAENVLAAGLMDQIGNIITLLSLRLTETGLGDLLQRFVALRTIMLREMKVAVYKWSFFTTAMSVAMAAALLLYLFHQNNVSGAFAAGIVVAVFQYLEQINSSLQSFGVSYQGLLRYRIDLSAIDPIREAAREVMPLKTAPYAAKWQQAELSHINFRYEDREHHIHQLNDVSLTLVRGQRIALVGSSGSGKSTLLRLLRGLHDPTSGYLTIDGAPQADFGVLAAVSTLIPQDTEIFENTLRYNIDFGSGGDVQPVIDMACLGPVIDPLPEKLDTDIRERGINLSGGQKQRLALARGLFAARDSSLLLLDEPTSSLDPVTEAAVFKNIFAAMQDTCIVAAIHRLHLLARFDYIYVMDRGCIVEQGTLLDLLESNGTLAQLYAAQKRGAV